MEGSDGTSDRQGFYIGIIYHLYAIKSTDCWDNNRYLLVAVKHKSALNMYFKS